METLTTATNSIATALSNEEDYLGFVLDIVANSSTSIGNTATFAANLTIFEHLPPMGKVISLVLSLTICVIRGFKANATGINWASETYGQWHTVFTGLLNWSSILLLPRENKYICYQAYLTMSMASNLATYANRNDPTFFALAFVALSVLNVASIYVVNKIPERYWNADLYARNALEKRVKLLELALKGSNLKIEKMEKQCSDWKKAYYDCLKSKILVESPKVSKRVRHHAPFAVKAVATSKGEAELEHLRFDVKTASDKVRELQATGAPKNDLDRAAFELKVLKKKLEDTELALTPKDALFERAKMEDLLKRRFFYDQSFAIYGGVTGLYDFGPMGCALKANMIDVWRKHFILEEGMLEVECSALTPENVLKASGHVERFIDWMVKDVKTGDCFRADHLIKNHAEALLKDKTTTPALKAELEDILIKLDGYDNNDMDAVIKKYGFKSPITKNDVSESVSFNLMFPSQIGDAKALLRPETTQGIFINFKRLFEINYSKLPFAAAQIGFGFRNEISPRQGLNRLHEFTMCDIEHFVDPTDKSHPKFGKIANLELLLCSARDQIDGQPAKHVKVADAVASKIIDNETLAYYMARTNLFLISVGVDPARLRFRQHMGNEMAHYAKDCWDAEIMTSYGWIKCVGHANRICYDLQQHAKAANVKLVAAKPLVQPKRITHIVPVPSMVVIGKAFEADGKLIKTLLEKLEPSEVTALAEGLKAGGYELSAANGKSFKLTPNMVSVKEKHKTLYVEEVIPSVIESSFGVGRVIYAVLEHSFRQREGGECYFKLKPVVAPYKTAILPTSGNEKLKPIITAVRDELSALHLSYRVDESGSSISQRYARTDELGIPFAITIDFESLNAPHTVILRDLASMQQIRPQLFEVAATILALCSGVSTWADVTAKFP